MAEAGAEAGVEDAAWTGNGGGAGLTLPAAMGGELDMERCGVGGGDDERTRQAPWDGEARKAVSGVDVCGSGRCNATRCTLEDTEVRAKQGSVRPHPVPVQCAKQGRERRRPSNRSTAWPGSVLPTALFSDPIQCPPSSFSALHSPSASPILTPPPGVHRALLGRDEQSAACGQACSPQSAALREQSAACG